MLIPLRLHRPLLVGFQEQHRQAAIIGRQHSDLSRLPISKW